MAPIRRYLRITKYSVLEVRIYLDNPALAHTWLLNPRNPVLPRVIQAVRPLVLPKLREENEKSKSKASKKRKGIKDIVAEDDFEVSIFLTDISTPHYLLTKDKNFQNRRSRIKSNSGKLTGWLTGTNENPVNVDGEDGDNEDKDDMSVVIREESDDENAMKLEDYPEATATDIENSLARSAQVPDNGPIVVDDVSDDEGFQVQEDGSTKTHDQLSNGENDDKKKLALNTSYEGFSIYGRILCLIVKRKGNVNKSSGAREPAGRQMLENWVSTQAAQDQFLGFD